MEHFLGTLHANILMYLPEAVRQSAELGCTRGRAGSALWLKSLSPGPGPCMQEVPNNDSGLMFYVFPDSLAKAETVGDLPPRAACL